MKLNGKEKFSYGLGAVGKDMVYMLSASYVLYYYQDILPLFPDIFYQYKSLMSMSFYYLLYPYKQLLSHKHVLPCPLILTLMN